MAYQQDDYGIYESNGVERVYKRIHGETIERRVPVSYPKVTTKNNSFYRNYTILPDILALVPEDWDDVRAHIADAGNRDLLLQHRRQHFDCIGPLIWERDHKNPAFALWNGSIIV